MKRKLTAVFLCLCLLGSLALNCFAGVLPLVNDFAGLLEPSQSEALEKKAQALQDAYQMDAVILTVDSLHGQTPMQFADDYFDDNGYGTDSVRSGTVFLISMEERDWYISASGDTVYALTDYALLQIDELVLPYLSNADYYGAFDAWLDALGTYFASYENGDPIDGTIPEEDKYIGHDETVFYEYDADDSFYDSLPINWGISLVVGIVVAVVAILIMRSAMNTRRKQNSAYEYLKNGSYHLRVRNDIFLYSQVSKTRRDTDSGSSSGGSRSSSHRSGSSVHRSSSGRMHGGRGGKF